MKHTKLFLIAMFIISINNLHAQTSFNISNQTSGDTLLTIDNEGKIGVGTTTPTADFHIIGTDGVFFGGSFGLGTIPVEGVGTRLVWYPRKAAFRAGFAAGTQWDDVNIGNYSTAVGLGTMANGFASTALGHSTTASGYYSTAMGHNSIASGFWSTAMGSSTIANGSYSTAMGGSTNASGPYSMAVGRSAIASGSYSIAFGQEIEASGVSTFAIGLQDMNGVNVSQNNTLAILGGQVGIGTSSPTEALEVADTIYSSIGGFKFPDGTVQGSAAGGGSASNTLDQAYDQGGPGAGRTITADAGAFSVGGVDGAVFSGTLSSGNIPATGAGTRMMFYPNKAAFRAGHVSLNQWDDFYIGNYSIALGNNPTANGLSSAAIGFRAGAGGDYSTAIGFQTLATGNYATALGSGASATGDFSVALGNGTSATGIFSTAMGSFTTASGLLSLAIGEQIEAAGNHTIAIGLQDMNGLTINQDSTLAIMGGKVGIESTAPTAELQVGGTDGVLFTGTYGSGTIPASGAGTRLMWYPGKAAFRAGNVDGTRWDDTNIGYYSMAMGFNSMANGNHSVAMGYNAEANGDFSFALGYNTITSLSGGMALGTGTRALGSSSTAIGVGTEASGNYSTAMGNNTIASGINSTAMGLETIASGSTSTAIGQNIEASGLNSIAIALQDMNGFNVSQNNTMSILGGRVGIESSAPIAELQVGGLDGAVFTGVFGTGANPYEGAGTRMLWFPRRAAFRAGYVDGTQWDNINMGPYSVAMGYNSIADGDASVALGRNTTANGDYCLATGNGTSAGFRYSTAMGFGTNANSQAATALGYNTTATGSNSTAMGYNSQATALTSTAMGNSTIADGDYSTAMGSVTTASGIGATATGGNTTASGNFSTAMGSYVQSSGANSFSIGDGSTTTVMNNSTTNQFMSRFANGYYLYTVSTLGLGAALPAGANSWVAISDSSKKENFRHTDSESILSKIKKFKLGTWNYKGQDPTKFRHYGPMAQDFYAAFGNDGIGTIGNDTTIASADFDGINLIAIQALEKRTAENKEETKNLKKENQKLKNEISLLKSKIEKFESLFSKVEEFTNQNNKQLAHNK